MFNRLVTLSLGLLAGMIWLGASQAKAQADSSASSKDDQATAWLSKGNDADVAKNYSLAMKYYKKAAQLGSANAEESIGFLYMKGNGTKKNWTKATDHFFKAAQIDPEEAYNIGILIECLDPQTGRRFIDNDDCNEANKKALDWYVQVLAVNNVPGAEFLTDKVVSELNARVDKLNAAGYK
jgi:TPR repeat protein